MLVFSMYVSYQSHYQGDGHIISVQTILRGHCVVGSSSLRNVD